MKNVLIVALAMQIFFIFGTGNAFFFALALQLFFLICPPYYTYVFTLKIKIIVQTRLKIIHNRSLWVLELVRNKIPKMEDHLTDFFRLDQTFSFASAMQILFYFCNETH